MANGIRCLPGIDEPYNGPGMPDCITFSGGMLGINFVDSDGSDLNAINRSINGTNFNGGWDITQAGMTVTLTQQLTGTGSFTKAGAGTVVLAPVGKQLVFGWDDPYGGFVASWTH